MHQYLILSLCDDRDSYMLNFSEMNKTDMRMLMDSVENKNHIRIVSLVDGMRFSNWSKNSSEEIMFRLM